MQVDDCIDCDGFLNEDKKANICIERRIFQKKNTDRSDPKNYYDFLWNDIVGTVVFFVISGM